MATTAFEVGNEPDTINGRSVKPRWGFLPFTYTFNMTGNPAATVPCGFSDDGMPMGLHIVGRMGDEEAVLAASAAFEQARPWIDNQPPIF